MKAITVLMCTLLTISAPALANYERNKAVAVQQVLFGDVQSVRNITEQELVQIKVVVGKHLAALCLAALLVISLAVAAGVLLLLFWAQ